MLWKVCRWMKIKWYNEANFEFINDLFSPHLVTREGGLMSWLLPTVAVCRLPNWLPLHWRSRWPAAVKGWGRRPVGPASASSCRRWLAGPSWPARCSPWPASSPRRWCRPGSGPGSRQAPPLGRFRPQTAHYGCPARKKMIVKVCAKFRAK